MSLDSKGCSVRIVRFIKETEKSLIAEICTYAGKIINGEKKYRPDFSDRIMLYKKGNTQVHQGDIVRINSFYIKNRGDYCTNKFYSIVVPDWEIVHRNSFVDRYYKRKISGELEQERLEKKRRKLEEEIEAEEQDLDEYIENNGEDGIPF